MSNIYRGSTVPGTGSTARGNAEDIDIEDTGNLIDATEVEGALQELATELDTAEAAIVVNSDGLSAHIADTTDAHAGTAITNTPAGDIAATTVQAAIDELDTEKEPADATILKDADIGVNVQAYDATIVVDADIGSTVQAYDVDIPTVVASQAEMEAGTETANRTMNPEGVAQAIAALSGAPIFTEDFTSSSQTIVSAGSLTLAHSLSSEPTLIQLYLVCDNTGQSGYSVGDKLYINGSWQITSSANDQRGVAVTDIDGTNITLRYASYADVWQILNKTTGVRDTFTPSRWRLVVRAWA